MALDDVRGAKPRVLKQNLGFVKPNFYQCEDINEKRRQRRTSPGQNNPLDPEYNVASVSGRKLHVIGRIDRSRPFVLQANSALNLITRAEPPHSKPQ